MREQPLFRNLDELNTRQDSIKFRYKNSKSSISFLHTGLCIKKNKLYTKLYRKQTDRQNFLHKDSEHTRSYSIEPSTKNQTSLYSIRRLWTSLQELKQFLEQGYNSELLDKHIKATEKLNRNELIKSTKKYTPINRRIPLAIIYNQFLPNINKIIRKNWNILSVNKSLKKKIKTNHNPGQNIWNKME